MSISTSNDDFIMLFAGGVMSTISDQSIINYFQKITPVHNFRRMYNENMRESGYAFFGVSADMVKEIISRPHIIGDTLINCKIAVDNTNIVEVQKEEMDRKIYVCNLPKNTSDVDLYYLFKQYGDVTKAYMVKNLNNGLPKQFGFVVFRTKEHIESLLASTPVIIYRGMEVQVRKAQDRQRSKPNEADNNNNNEDHNLMNLLIKHSQIPLQSNPNPQVNLFNKLNNMNTVATLETLQALIAHNLALLHAQSGQQSYPNRPQQQSVEQYQQTLLQYPPMEKKPLHLEVTRSNSTIPIEKSEVPARRAGNLSNFSPVDANQAINARWKRSKEEPIDWKSHILNETCENYKTNISLTYVPRFIRKREHMQDIVLS